MILITLLSTTLILTLTILYFRQRNKALTKRPPIPYEAKQRQQQPLSNDNKKKKTKNILIIGGNGFIAKYLIQQLLDKYSASTNDANTATDKNNNNNNNSSANVNENIHIHVFDISPLPSTPHPQITFIRGDITQLDHLVKATANMDLVYHMASLIPSVGITREMFWKVNVVGTENVIAACQQNNVPALVYTSSATVIIGRNNLKIENASESYPYCEKGEFLDDYTESKTEAEKLIIQANNSTTLATAVLRPSAVFGRGDKNIADHYMANLSNFYLGEGTCLVDFVHVGSVAQGHLLCGEKLAPGSPLCGQIYNLGSGTPVEYRAFRGVDPKFDWGSPSKPTSLNYGVAMALAMFNEYMYALIYWSPFGAVLSRAALAYTQRTYYFNIEKAKKDFGYKPVPTVEAVAACLKEYRASIKTKGA